jgi:hypothetical protein
MQHQRADRRTGIVWAATVATTAGLSALALASPASAESIEQYIEVPQCQPATSQVCPQEPEVNFTAGNGTSGEFVDVQFTANQNHCSDLIVHIFNDGYPQFSGRVGPGQTVQKGLGVGPGNHVLRVRAEGIEGGCNTGVLSSWGGTVRIDSA